MVIPERQDGAEQPEQMTFFPDVSIGEAEKQRANIMALALIRGLGEASLRALVRRYGNLEQVWTASPHDLNGVLISAGLRAPGAIVDHIILNRRHLLEAAYRELEHLRGEGIHLLTPLDSVFPRRLLETKDSPKWLFVQGSFKPLTAANLVAVVGTRKPSQHGIAIARALTSWLANQEFWIVAGLAEGIDEVAHLDTAQARDADPLCPRPGHRRPSADAVYGLAECCWVVTNPEYICWTFRASVPVSHWDKPRVSQTGTRNIVGARLDSIIFYVTGRSEWR